MPHTDSLTADTQDVKHKHIWTKRAFDVIFSLIGLLLSSPLFLLGSAPSQSSNRRDPMILQSKASW